MTDMNNQLSLFRRRSRLIHSMPLPLPMPEIWGNVGYRDLLSRGSLSHE